MVVCEIWVCPRWSSYSAAIESGFSSMFGCYTDSSGVCVRNGQRQSMPSSNMDNRARTEVNATVPLSVCGQMKRLSQLDQIAAAPAEQRRRANYPA